MEYISKYDTKLVTFMNKKYKKNKVKFKTFDDYILWLYYIFCRCNEEFYYRKLEKDVMEYSNLQTGTPRELEKTNGDWKKLEKDKAGLLSDDDYVEYLRKMVWKK